LGDLTKRLLTFAYFPFSGDPRFCIGKFFATMETVLLLTNIAQQFRLTLVPNQEVTPWSALKLRPKYRIKMLLAKR
jgi:cytochrome P450